MIPQRLRYPLLLSAIVICFFWKLVFTGHYTWLQAPDFASQNLPWYQFQASEWHAGRIPLWSPYEWTGHSLIGQSQPGVVDPLNLLLYAMPLKNGWIQQWALHWFYVLGYLCGVLAFYAFCRRGMLLSRQASMVAALGYGLGGIPASTNWPQMAHATIWGPLALLFQFRAVREDKPIVHGAYSGAMLGLMWLAGHHQIPIYFTIASALLWVYFLYTHFVTKPGLLPGAAMAAVFLVLFGALQILPSSEYGQHALRWVGHDDPVGWQDKVPYRIHGIYSMRPIALLGTFFKTFEAYNPFLGVTLLSMTAFGIAARWRDSATVRLLVWMGGLAILYALGASGFLQGPLYALVPVIEKTRVPAVAMILFQLAAAALAGFGIDALQKHDGLAKKFSRIGAITLAVMTLTGAVIYFLKVRETFWTSEWVLATGAIGLCTAVFKLRPRWTPAILAVGVCIELSSVNGGDWENQSEPGRAHFADDLAQNADIAAFLASKARDRGRIQINLEPFAYSFGDWWGLETIDGVAASIPAAIWRMEPFLPAIRKFASIRYYVGKDPTEPGQIEMFRGKSGLKVFEDTHVFPRAWLVHDVKTVADIEAVRIWMQNQGDARLREAIVQGPAPQLETCEVARESVQFLRRIPNRLTLRVRTNCRAMLIVNDAWYPGWIARADGRSLPVHQVDGFVRGVVVEKGVHEIDLLFRPLTVAVGAVFLLLGIVGIAILTRIGSRGKAMSA